MNGRSRPRKDGPEEITWSGDSEGHRSKVRVNAVRLIATSILLDPASYGESPDDDLTVRFQAAEAIVNSVSGLTHVERLAVTEALPWHEATRRRWGR